MYDNIVVEKPWGYEYLCYKNSELAIWLLHIKKGFCTSLHCHPNKHTGLVVLEGSAQISFLRGYLDIKGLEKINIFRGRFHSTKSFSDGGVFMLEIESPENKHDLLRLEDNYGREDQPYEGRDAFIPKDDNCIQLSEPGELEVQFKGCSICHLHFVKKDDFLSYTATDFFAVSSGGVISTDGAIVLRPSDVVDGITLGRLLRSFEIIPNSSIIRIVKDKSNG